jgi:hypothetical protein
LIPKKLKCTFVNRRTSTQHTRSYEDTHVGLDPLAKAFSITSVCLSYHAWCIALQAAASISLHWSRNVEYTSVYIYCWLVKLMLDLILKQNIHTLLTNYSTHFSYYGTFDQKNPIKNQSMRSFYTLSVRDYFLQFIRVIHTLRFFLLI